MELREPCRPSELYLGAHSPLEFPHRFRPDHHGRTEHMDYHPLEGERQDVELYFCSLPSTRRTLTLRSLLA